MSAPNVADEMVARFLAWKLPQDFSPDCHIRFDRDAADAGSWPVGTNLLNAIQARAMLKHVLDVAPGPLDFGDAIRALKAGKRVARAGWNGKGMWLSLSCDGTREVPAENFWSPHNAEHARQSGGTATVLPSITMKTATGEILMGWLASQSDMLATDWVVL
jgi:hypothetical protein